MDNKTKELVEKGAVKGLEKGTKKVYKNLLYKTSSSLETLRLTNMGISTIAVVGAWNFSTHKNAYDKIVSVGKELSDKIVNFANEAGMMWNGIKWENFTQLAMDKTKNVEEKHFKKFHFKRPTKSLRSKDKGNKDRDLSKSYDI